MHILIKIEKKPCRKLTFLKIFAIFVTPKHFSNGVMKKEKLSPLKMLNFSILLPLFPSPKRFKSYNECSGMQKIEVLHIFLLELHIMYTALEKFIFLKLKHLLATLLYECKYKKLPLPRLFQSRPFRIDSSKYKIPHTNQD